MIVLPDTVQPEEIVWTLLSAVAVASSVMVWLSARADLRIAERSTRPALAAKFRAEAMSVLSRLLLAGALLAAGVLAMFHPPATHGRSPSSWIILVLIFAAPIQIILRNDAEMRARRALLRDVARRARNGGQTPDQEAQP